MLTCSSRSPDPIEQRHQRLEGEDAQRGKAIGGGERKQFRDQIAKQDDDGEDDGGGEPLRNARGQRSFPDEEKTEDDEGNVDERVGRAGER